MYAVFCALQVPIIIIQSLIYILRGYQDDSYCKTIDVLQLSHIILILMFLVLDVLMYTAFVLLLRFFVKKKKERMAQL